MLAIEIDNLHKSFDRLAVLRGVDVHVPTGQAYGLLGPNGAGKSTLVNLMLGFLTPGKGSVRVLGSANLEATRSRIGYLPERLRYHLRFTAREYLRALGQFNDLGGRALSSRIDDLLGLVELRAAADRQLATYSKGMLQRFGIAQALLSDPELLLIDEPTAGLDPGGQHEMLDLLADLKRSGHTIFMATHILDEAERLCDTVGVLFDGRIAADVDVRMLRAPGALVRISVAELPHATAERLRALAPAVRCDEREVIIQPNTPALQAQVLRALIDDNVAIIALDPVSRPLEELYLRVARGEAPPETPVPAPPNGLFAPPGHPDAADVAAARPRAGDTLLRELLRQEEQSRDEDRR